MMWISQSPTRLGHIFAVLHWLLWILSNCASYTIQLKFNFQCFSFQLDIMAVSKMKAEIQALTSFSSDYLSKVYLPNKLQFGGWIWIFRQPFKRQISLRAVKTGFIKMAVILNETLWSYSVWNFEPVFENFFL